MAKTPILDWNRVRAMRALARDPAVTYRALAKQFGVAPSTAACVVQGKTWKDPSYKPRTKPKAKLTWPMVRAIRQRYAAGETGMSLAEAFNVSNVAVHFVVMGKNWREDPEGHAWKPAAPRRSDSRRAA